MAFPLFVLINGSAIEEGYDPATCRWSCHSGAAASRRASVSDCKTNGGRYGAGPILRGFEEIAAALKGFGLGSGVQAGAHLQQVSGKTLAALC